MTAINTERLVDWFQGHAGQTLLRQQRLAIEDGIAHCFGYHQLEFLVDSRLPVGECSRLGHRILAVPEWQPDLPESTLVCLPHEIPLGSDAIDLVILHHTLDVAEQPHQTLREVARVLRSGGHLVVTGFNPFSWWGLRHLVEWHRREPWNLRFLRASRLEDWLSLLDFRVRSVNLQAARPPLLRSESLRRWGLVSRLVKRLKLPVGSFYVIVAQKRAGCLTPVARSWKSRRLVGLASVHPLVPCKSDEKR